MTRAESTSGNELSGVANLVELGSGWSWTTLGEVAEFYNGDRSSNYPKQSDFVADGVPFVNTGHIDPTGRLALNEMNYITRACFDRLRAGKLRSGDVVYCLRGSTIGKIARVALDEGAIASSLVIIRPKPNATQDYLYFFLSSPLGQRLVRQHDNGSAQPNLSVQAISRYPILLPTIAEQRAIASTLNSLDDKIEQNRRTGRKLEQLARATFKAWFADFEPVKAKAARQTSFPGMPPAAFAALPDRLADSRVGPVPQGWEVGTLDDVLLLQRGFDLPRAARSNGPFLVYAASGINGWHNESKVKGPGVTTGRSGVLGQVFFADRDFWPLNTSLWVKEYRRSNPWHAYYFLQTVGLDRFNAGSAVPTLNRNHLRQIAAVLASSELLEAFAETCGRLFELRAHFEAESSKLAALRDYLLPRLLSGRVRVGEAKSQFERSH